MRTDVQEPTPESLASKRFRSSSTNGDQPHLEISGSGFESLAASPSLTIPSDSNLDTLAFASRIP